MASRRESQEGKKQFIGKNVGIKNANMYLATCLRFILQDVRIKKIVAGIVAMLNV